MNNYKSVVVSCGPIPARLDSVKFITNRFKGGLAFKTAEHLIEKGFAVTIVKWKHTQIDAKLGISACKVIDVEDVFDYYKWFQENAVNYDAFVMAAAVANLTPSKPYEGKFPSHQYVVGEKFNIQFEIAPRAIDIIKKVNPRACLIGYKLFDADTDEELIEIARHTLTAAKANIIFANTPQDAKERKIAVFADNTVIGCDFDAHLDMIVRAINQQYYKTVVEPMTDEERHNARIQHAIAITKMFEQTFPGFGTVAIPVDNNGAFVTTHRGHQGEPVLVRRTDDSSDLNVFATDKATLNAPLLGALVYACGHRYIVVHRHENDPLYLYNQAPFDVTIDKYLFPGTAEEVFQVIKQSLSVIRLSLVNNNHCRIKLMGHGDISILPIRDVNWQKYYTDFPGKYFSIPYEMQGIIDLHYGEETLELGANRFSEAKYAYDPYVKNVDAENLTWDEVLQKQYKLVYAKNAINYLPKDKLCEVLERTELFVANTFREAPQEKVSEIEASVAGYDEYVYHALRHSDDSITVHRFYAYTEKDYKELGLDVKPYGDRSLLITKGI